MKYAISCCHYSSGATVQRCTGFPVSWFMSLISKRRRWQTQQTWNSTLCVCTCVCVCVWISNLISSESFILREKGTVTLWYDISSYSRKFYLLIIIRLLRRIRKASIFFVVLIRLSVRVEQLGSQWMHFHKISFLKVFRKSVEKKFKIYLNLTRITGALYEDQYTFLI